MPRASTVGSVPAVGWEYWVARTWIEQHYLCLAVERRVLRGFRATRLAVRSELSRAKEIAKRIPPCIVDAVESDLSSLGLALRWRISRDLA